MIIIIFISLLSVASSQKYNECPPSNTICEFRLEIEEKLAMVYQDCDANDNCKSYLVKAVDSKLYKFNESTITGTEIPIDEVVTVDGVDRMVIAINKTIPGPALVVYEDQIVTVHVHNYLLSDAVTIHWHGIHQRGTPFMDGVGYITQCPIGAGQYFSYKFKASPKGTFWYHSHVGAQRTNGVFGAFIIKEKPKVGVVLPEDLIMTVMDWHHYASEEVYQKMLYGNFRKGKEYKPTNTLDGGMFSDVPWVSGLIEGKGRYTDPDDRKTTETPLTKYTVMSGKKYRFRVIHTGTIYPLRISIDQHNLTVVASDGYDLKPMVVESFIINPGERFDFELTANRYPDNYWIRSDSLEDIELTEVQHTSSAILHYNGTRDTEPRTSRVQCTKAKPCEVINCPFRYFPRGYNMNCHLFSDLKNADQNDKVPEFVTNDSEEHFLNFAFPGTSVTPGAVNGRQFVLPGANSLIQGSGEYDCKKKDCGEDKTCSCHYELKVPYDKTIQMVWLNVGEGAGWAHPIHLHGHSFYVLKMEYYPQYRSTGKLTKPSKQLSANIACGGDQQKPFCNEARWKNSSWKNGNIPGLNLENPPRKDTLIIPTGGYAVIRIRSNNRGKWFMHCHIEVHSLNGMAMVLSEDANNADKPPPGFPECKNFYSDPAWDDIPSLNNAKLITNGISMLVATITIFIATQM